jgi:hypothetical protein
VTEISAQANKWAHLDSNQGQPGYEPGALTAELWALEPKPGLEPVARFCEVKALPDELCTRARELLARSIIAGSSQGGKRTAEVRRPSSLDKHLYCDRRRASRFGRRPAKGEARLEGFEPPTIRFEVCRSVR